MSEQPYQRWYFLSRLSHQDVCQRMRDDFELPEFRFDSEIENDWAIAEKDGVEVNVSFDTQSRGERNEELPTGWPDTNFTIVITQKNGAIDGLNWYLDVTVNSMSQRLADLLEADVYYLNGWEEKRVPRFMVFSPIKRP